MNRLSKNSPLLVSFIVCCCTSVACSTTRQLLPPLTPERIVPQIESRGTPGPGRGRVTLDVVDGPTIVEKLNSGSASGSLGMTHAQANYQLVQNLCMTPCVVDLPHGPYNLRFTLKGNPSRTSLGQINVDQQPSFYRHALGTKKDNRWKAYVGWPLAILGGLGIVGAVVASTKKDATITPSAAIGGGLLFAGLTGLGVWLIYGSDSIKQPGAGIQWH